MMKSKSSISIIKRNGKKSSSNKTLLSCLVWMMFVGASGINNQLVAQDRYADIGGKQYNTREHLLEEKTPPQLEEVYLPVSNNPSATFKQTDRMDTDAELEQELKRTREKYKPFTRKLAPDIESRD